MKTMLILLLIAPWFSYAHCPIGFEIEGASYCTEIKWLNGDQKVGGSLIPSELASPQLVLTGEIPHKWIYSKAQFLIWLDGDRDHNPQVIKDFRIFPYMIMESGHHHSTSHEFRWNPALKVYEVSGMVFQEMPGCWSFRWTTAETNAYEESHALESIAKYVNLSEEQGKQIKTYCELSGTTGTGGDHSSDHTHSHHH